MRGGKCSPPCAGSGRGRSPGEPGEWLGRADPWQQSRVLSGEWATAPARSGHPSSPCRHRPPRPRNGRTAGACRRRVGAVAVAPVSPCPHEATAIIFGGNDRNTDPVGIACLFGWDLRIASRPPAEEAGAGRAPEMRLDPLLRCRRHSPRKGSTTMTHSTGNGARTGGRGPLGFFRNLKTARKLLAGFLVMVGRMAGIGALSLSKLGETNDRLDGMTTGASRRWIPSAGWRRASRRSVSGWSTTASPPRSRTGSASTPASRNWTGCSTRRWPRSIG